MVKTQYNVKDRGNPPPSSTSVENNRRFTLDGLFELVIRHIDTNQLRRDIISVSWGLSQWLTDFLGMRWQSYHFWAYQVLASICKNENEIIYFSMFLFAKLNLVRDSSYFKRTSVEITVLNLSPWSVIYYV